MQKHQSSSILSKIKKMMPQEPNQKDLEFLSNEDNKGNKTPYQFQIVDVLRSFLSGKGTYQIKYETKVAIKCLQNASKNEQSFKKDTEVSYIISREPSANVIDIYKVQEVVKQGRTEKAFIIMEKGKCQLDGARKEDIKNKLKYIGHIASGLSHLHKCGIVHRDIKEENVLITWGNIAKIFDFGASKYYGCLEQGQNLKYELNEDQKSQKVMMNTQEAIGTQIFNPPEILLSSVQTKVIGSSDMWQFGLLVAQFIWGLTEASSKNYKSDCQKSLQQWSTNPTEEHKFKMPKIQRIGFEGEESLINLTQRCLYYHPDKRIKSEVFVKEFYSTVLKDSNIDMIKRESFQSIQELQQSPMKTPEAPKNMSESVLKKQVLKNFISKCCKELRECETEQKKKSVFQNMRREALEIYKDKGEELVKHLLRLIQK